MQAVDGVSFELDRGKVLGIVGESGSGKSVTAMTLLGLTRDQNTRFEGEVLYKGRDVLKMDERRAPGGPRQRDVDDLPGSDDVAEPGLHDRGTDRARRSGPTSEPTRTRREGARSTSSSRSGFPNADSRVDNYPARVLRRHAPARDDRDGARLQPRRPDRRRADDGARRDDPGADHRADRPTEGRVQLGGDPDHARPRRRRGRRGRDHRHVRRPRRRARADAPALLRPAASVHVGPARLDPAARPAEAGAAALDQGARRRR